MLSRPNCKALRPAGSCRESMKPTVSDMLSRRNLIGPSLQNFGRESMAPNASLLIHYAVHALSSRGRQKRTASRRSLAIISRFRPGSSVSARARP
jgi:hypothetical protein